LELFRSEEQAGGGTEFGQKKKGKYTFGPKDSAAEKKKGRQGKATKHKVKKIKEGKKLTEWV